MGSMFHVEHSYPLTYRIDPPNVPRGTILVQDPNYINMFHVEQKNRHFRVGLSANLNLKFTW